jgi:site-specific recombinase XerD
MATRPGKSADSAELAAELTPLSYNPGFHAFARHSVITHRLNNGQSLTEVSERARHATLHMTMRYSQFAGNGSDPLPELE